MKIRRGEFAVYQNSEYRLLRSIHGKKTREGMIYLLSENKADLEEGFVPINEEYNQEIGVFQCVKEVALLEITKQYCVSTRCNYCGVVCDFLSSSDPNKYHLQTIEGFFKGENYESDSARGDIVKKLVSNGFIPGYELGHGLFLYEAFVDMNDPEISIYEIIE